MKTKLVAFLVYTGLKFLIYYWLKSRFPGIDPAVVFAGDVLLFLAISVILRKIKFNSNETFYCLITFGPLVIIGGWVSSMVSSTIILLSVLTVKPVSK